MARGGSPSNYGAFVSSPNSDDDYTRTLSLHIVGVDCSSGNLDAPVFVGEPQENAGSSSFASSATSLDIAGPPRTNYSQTIFNIMNVFVGAGMLSIPFAMRESGWAVGLSLLVLFALVAMHTGKLLQRCISAAPGMSVRPSRIYFEYTRLLLMYAVFYSHFRILGF